MIKINKKSLVEFQFGDNEPIIKLDIIAIADEWHAVNFALRVADGDNWVVPADKHNEFAANRLNFVQAIVNASYPEGAPVPELTRAEAEDFIQQVRTEVDKLRNFIYPKSEESSSVPESTAPQTFSQ